MREEFGVGRELAPSSALSRIEPRPGLSDRQGLTKQILLQFLLVALKWKWLILGLAAAFGVAGAIGIYLKPPLYRATARILLKPDRTALQISGLSSVHLRNPHYPAQIMQSEVEMLKSRAVVLPVARDWLTRHGVLGENGEVPREPLEMKLASLLGNLVTVTLPDTNVIEVTYLGPTPDEAERTLSAIVGGYLEQHAVAQGGSVKLLEFYERETERTAVELRTAEEGLGKWQEQAKVVAIDQEITAAIEALSARQRTLRNLDSEIQSMTSRIAALRNQLRSEPPVIVIVREKVVNPLVAKLRADVIAAENAVRDTDKDPVLTKLRADLVAADVALQDLLARYTERDRRVEEKREQVAVLRRELAAVTMQVATAARERGAFLKQALEAAEREGEILGREATGPNPVRERLENELGMATAKLPSLLSERDAVRRQVDELRPALDGMREKKLEAARQARAVDVRKDEFLLYRKRLDEARLSAGLDKEELANLTVIDRPHAELGSDVKKRIAIAILAPIVGLALGLAIALGIEFFRNPIRTHEDVEHYLGLPVLATIPELGPRQMRALNAKS